MHSEQGARPGEHSGRSRNLVIKIRDLAWPEFEKPDLVRAEAFARAFGFSPVLHTSDELYLRGTDPGTPCVIIRRGGWPARRVRRSASCKTRSAAWPST